MAGVAVGSSRVRLRVVSNFGDGDCGAGEIHTRARKFEETRREFSALPSRRVSSNFRARVCISPGPQSPSPKLETTRSLSGVNYLTFKKVEKKPFNVCRFYCPFLLSFLYICYRIPVKRLTENSRGIKQKQNLPSIKTVA